MTTNNSPARPKVSRGRPTGAKNITESADVTPSRCPKCGSSARSKYLNTQRRNFANAGTEFIAINYRRCRCLDCGQTRVDREPEYPPEKKHAA